MGVYVHTTVSDRDEADASVQALLNAGFPVRDIGMLQKTDSKVERVKLDHKTNALPASAVGAVIGAVLATVLFSVVGPALPPIGGFQFGTPEGGLSVLGAAIAGGLFGGLAAGIAGLGFWKEKPDLPKHPHMIAVGVHTYDDRVARAAGVLREQGAREVFASTEAAAIERLNESNEQAQAA